MPRIACRTAIAILVSLTVFIQAVQSQWAAVPAIDLSKFKPSDFTDDELDMPYYLQHFHTFANSVLETGPDKGFININVWRTPDVNKPFNARIMENILSLTYISIVPIVPGIYIMHLLHCDQELKQPYHSGAVVKMPMVVLVSMARRSGTCLRPLSAQSLWEKHFDCLKVVRLLIRLF